MRPVVLILLAALVAPGAAGQGVAPAHATLVAQPPDRAIAPLTEVVRVPLVLTTSCPPGSAAPGGLTATFAIRSLPRWATAVIEPAQMTFEQVCTASEVVLETTLELRVSDQAPAFHAAPVDVEATVRSTLSQETFAATTFPIVAGYFSVLDIVRGSDVIVPDADGLGGIDLVVSNIGNGPTRVVFEVGEGSRDLAISPPRPLLLGSKHTGEGSIRDEAHLRVQRIEPGEGPTTFSLRYRASYILDPSIPGDEGEMAFQVLPAYGMGGGSALEELAARDPSDQRDLPFGALLLVGAALSLAALVRRR